MPHGERSLGFEILRVAVGNRVIWLVPVFETFLRRFESKLVERGKERKRRSGMGAKVNSFII